MHSGELFDDGPVLCRCPTAKLTQTHTNTHKHTQTHAHTTRTHTSPAAYILLLLLLCVYVVLCVLSYCVCVCVCVCDIRRNNMLLQHMCCVVCAAALLMLLDIPQRQPRSSAARLRAVVVSLLGVSLQVSRFTWTNFTNRTNVAFLTHVSRSVWYRWEITIKLPVYLEQFLQDSIRGHHVTLELHLTRVCQHCDDWPPRAPVFLCRKRFQNRHLLIVILEMWSPFSHEGSVASVASYPTVFH